MALPNILPPHIYRAVREGKVIQSIIDHGNKFYNILNSKVPLTKVDYAKLSNLGAILASTIVNCLPVPEEVK